MNPATLTIIIYCALLLAWVALIVAAVFRPKRTKPANRLPLRLVHENRERDKRMADPFHNYQASNAWKTYQASQRLEKI